MAVMKNRAFKIVGTAFGFALTGLAAWVLYHEISKYGLHEIASGISSIPASRVASAAIFAACCYAALTFYDLIALRYLGNRLPYRKVALASFVGYAFAHNVGLSLVTAAPMKYRIYSAWGIGALDVVKVVAFCGATFWTGFAFLAGLAFLFEPTRIPEIISLHGVDARLAGIILLGFIGAYLVLGLKGKNLKVGKFLLRIPSTRFGLAQVAAGSCEWIFASAVLYSLFTPELPISYPAFLCVFLFAYVSGFASQVPGGLGVFDTLILLSLKG
ncbi:MAG TPA: hypothetical protein PLY45_00775, partial [bacterium]|nr:hypothetical protein [bacterium]